MPDGFKADPGVIRAYGDLVFNEASTQVTQIQESFSQRRSTAEDFGKSWHDQGGRFQTAMDLIATDVGKLAEYLAAVGTQLSQTSDIMISADSSGAGTIAASGEDVKAGGEE